MKKLFNEQECAGKTINKMIIDDGRLTIHFTDDAVIVLDGYTQCDYGDYSYDIISVCQDDDISIYQKLELGLVTEEDVERFEEEEDKIFIENEKQQLKFQLKQLMNSMKKKDIPKEEIMQIIGSNNG